MSHVVTASLYAALLAGCGGAPQASDPPTPTASSTSDPSQTVDEPTRDSMTRHGARQFVERYIENLNEATATGNVREIRSLDDGSCESCQSTIAAIEDIYKTGGSIQGGEWTPTIINQLPREQGWVVDTKLLFAPQTVTDGGGKIERYKGGEGLASFIVVQAGDQWRVDEWTRAE